MRDYDKAPISRKKITFGIIFVIVAFICLIFSNKLIETVEKGTYDIIQRPVTGTMEAKMETGMYMQGFSDVYTWPTSETFFFIGDATEGGKTDQAIEVQFNDGSLAKISGTCRVLMPTSDKEAIHIMTGMNFKNYDDLEARFILPVVRNAMRLTANLMTARESYAEKRPDFITYTWDQIQNGTFQTEERVTTVEDPISKQLVSKSYKVIKKDSQGNPLRDQDPLQGTGITLANFEIKEFIYEEKVRKQISEQQENMMAIATARAQAERAEQDAKTSEARGKTEVMKVRYTQLQLKEKAVIEADQEKEVAETNAAKELEVAKLNKLAAEQEKQKQILLGQGESERKKLVMAADGALKQKLDAIIAIQAEWAQAYKERKVPSVYMSGGDAKSGGNDPDTQFQTFMNMMNIQAAKQLSLDMEVQGTDKK